MVVASSLARGCSIQFGPCVLTKQFCRFRFDQLGFCINFFLIRFLVNVFAFRPQYFPVGKILNAALGEIFQTPN